MLRELRARNTEVRKHLVCADLLVDCNLFPLMDINYIFSRLAESLELVAVFGKGASGGNGAIRGYSEPHARKNPFIANSAFFVEVAKVIFTAVERIEVLHEKFPPPHNAALRAFLVPELSLYLKERARQVFVRLNMRTHECGNFLLLRPAKASLPARVNHALKPHVALPARGLLPYIRILQ